MRANRMAMVVIWLIAISATASAAGDPEQIQRGEALLKTSCASCHAIGDTGISPHSAAPPFRTLSRNYPIEALEEALAEGIMSGHPDMPEFKFEPPDVGAIIAYLKSVQAP